MSLTLSTSLNQSNTDEPADTLITGMEEICKSVCKLKAENADLERLKNLSTIHLQQYQQDIESLKAIHKYFKQLLDNAQLPPAPPPQVVEEPPAPPAPQIPRQINSPTNLDAATLSHTHDLQWSIQATPAGAFYDKSTVSLRYALKLESVLCTIRFNHDGTLFAFADGKNVFIMQTADGSLVGACEILKTNQTNEAHTRSLCFSPDNQFLAISGPSNSVIVFSVSTKKVVANLEGHANIVSALVFYSDSKKLLSGGFDGKIIMWDMKNFTPIKTIQHGSTDENSRSKEDMIIGMSMASNDGFVSVGFMNGSVGIYDPTFDQPMISFIAHSEYLLDITTSVTDMIATASHDHTAKLWTLRGVATCRNVLQGHKDFVLTVCFSPMDQILFTGSKDETINAWDQSSGELLFTLLAHKNTLFQVDHHPTERVLVSCSGDGLVCLWDYKMPPQ